MRPRLVPSLTASLHRTMLVAALGPLVAASACHARDDQAAEQVSERDAKRLLHETPWLDHLPADEHDTIDLLQFDRRAHGVYVHGSAYRGSYEAFQYEATGDELRLTFLDGEVQAKTRYRIERIKRGGFDLRLTLTHSPRGPSAYYGFDSRRELPESVRAVLPAAR
jgi:hypothetical protein